MADRVAVTFADADVERRVRASFARQGLMTTLGASMASVLPGEVVIEVPFSAGLSQQQGFFHGGVLGAIADSAAGFACLTLMPAGSEVVTVEYKINFMRPAVGVMLRAHGKVLRAGRSITIAQASVAALDQGRSADCGLMQATFMRVDV